MKRLSCERGFTLIELIIFIVVIGLVMAGMVSVVGQVLSRLHHMPEYIQGYFLVQAMVDQMNAQDAEAEIGEIVSGSCQQPNGVTPWVAGDVAMTCEVDEVVAVPNFVTNSFECTNQIYTEEPFKCVTITIRSQDSNEVISFARGLYAQSQ